MTNLVDDLVSALIGSTAGLILRTLQEWHQELRGPYTGTWYGTAYSEQGEPIKHDTFCLKQRGDKITGTISRTFPQEENYRKWQLSAMVIGNELYGSFWPTEKSIVSYGSWCLKQDTDDRFIGYYLSWKHETHTDLTRTETLKTTRCTLDRYRTSRRDVGPTSQSRKP